MREALKASLLLVRKFQFAGKPVGMSSLRGGGREGGRRDGASPVSDVT